MMGPEKVVYHRRRSSDSAHRNRRRSVGDSFAEYNQDQVNLTRLAIQALKQYLTDDLSDDEEEENTLSSFGYSTDNDDSFVSEENTEVSDLGPYTNDDKDEESVDLCDLGSISESEQGNHSSSIQNKTCNNKVLTSSLVNFNDLSYAASPNKKKKLLSFGNITIREYAITVGALSASNDQCPLQLSWEHGADIQNSLPRHTVTQQDVNCPTTPRRLSLFERRRRIASIQGIPVNEVDKLQFDNVLTQIKEAMSSIQNDMG